MGRKLDTFHLFIANILNTHTRKCATTEAVHIIRPTTHFISALSRTWVILGETILVSLDSSSIFKVYSFREMFILE